MSKKVKLYIPAISVTVNSEDLIDFLVAQGYGREIVTIFVNDMEEAK